MVDDSTNALPAPTQVLELPVSIKRVSADRITVSEGGVHKAHFLHSVAGVPIDTCMTARCMRKRTRYKCSCVTPTHSSRVLHNLVHSTDANHGCVGGGLAADSGLHPRTKESDTRLIVFDELCRSREIEPLGQFDRHGGIANDDWTSSSTHCEGKNEGKEQGERGVDRHG